MVEWISERRSSAHRRRRPSGRPTSPSCSRSQLDVPRCRSRCRRRPRSSSPTRATCTRPARPSAVPWAGDVALGREAGADQPLRQAGVEAAGDRVLDGDAVCGEEGPHLDRASSRPGRVARRRRRGRGRPTPRRARREHRLGASRAATATQPGPLSTHCGGDERGRIGAERLRATARRSAARPGRCAPAAAPANASARRRGGSAPGRRRTAGRRRRRAACPPRPQPGVAGAERRVAGERQLARRREDADAVVGARRRSARAGTSSRSGWSSCANACMLRVVERVGAVHDGERVALQRRRGEDVDLVEAEGRAHESAPWPSAGPPGGRLGRAPGTARPRERSASRPPPAECEERLLWSGRASALMPSPRSRRPARRCRARSRRRSTVTNDRRSVFGFGRA